MGMTYQRGAVWWVKYYRNGRPIRESSGSTKEGDAIQLLKIREGDIAHGLPVNPKLNRFGSTKPRTISRLSTPSTAGGRPTSSSVGFDCICFRPSAADASPRSQPPT
jgi:hypothetical protein